MPGIALILDKFNVAEESGSLDSLDVKVRLFINKLNNFPFKIIVHRYFAM